MKNGAAPHAANPWMNYKAIGLSCAAGALTAFAATAAGAFVMSRRGLSAGAAVPISVAAILVGCLPAGALCGRLLRERGLLCGALCGAGLFLLAFAAEMIFGDGGCGPMAVYKLGLYLTAAMTGGVLGVNRRSRVKKPKVKRR